MKDLSKLPVWAQDEIKALRIRVEETAKRARAYEEKTPTAVYIKNLHFSVDDKPLFLPPDRQIRFCTGKADWQYVDVRLKTTTEMRHEGQTRPETFVELMAGADIHIAPEVRNVSRIYVR